MQLNLYFLYNYMVTSLMILIGLIIVVWLNHALRIMEFVLNKGASVADFLLLSVFPIPLWLMIALPMAGFIGIIWVIAKLLSDRELVVIQAVGISPVQFSFIPILFGSMLTILLLINSVFLLPNSFSQFKKTQSEIRSSIPKLLVQNNVFIDISDGLTLFVGKRISNNEVAQVFIQDSRNDKQIITYTAEKGTFTSNNGSPILLLENGQRSELNKDRQSSAQLTFETHSLSIGTQIVDPGVSNVIDMNEDSILNLLDPSKAISPDFVKERMAMGHYRLASPFLSLALAIIAVSILVQGGILRENITKRIILASVIGISVQTIMIISRSLTVITPSLWPAIYLSVLLPSIIGLTLIWRPLLYNELVQIMSLSKHHINNGHNQ